MDSVLPELKTWTNQYYTLVTCIYCHLYLFTIFKYRITYCVLEILYLFECRAKAARGSFASCLLYTFCVLSKLQRIAIGENGGGRSCRCMCTRNETADCLADSCWQVDKLCFFPASPPAITRIIVATNKQTIMPAVERNIHLSLTAADWLCRTCQ